MTGQTPRAHGRDDGFSLIELLIVIIVIGILAGIAIPIFLNQRQKGYEAQARADLRNIATAEETYVSDQPGNYVACDPSNGSSGCAAMLANQVWKPSPNAKTAVGADADKGFCAISKASPPGTYFVYDSEAGGLQSTKASAFASITWPTGGACAASAARPASF